MSVNLLSFHFQKNCLIQRQLRLWCVIWIGCAAGALLWLTEPSLSLWRQLAELLQLEQDVQPMVWAEARNDDLDRSILRTRAEEQRMRRLQPPERSLVILGILSDAARHVEKLQLQRATLSLVPETDLAAGEAATRGKTAADQGLLLRAAQQTLQLQGIAADDATVMKFVERLQHASVFENVELKSTAEFPLPRDGGRQFQIECRFGGAP
ncbi:MAG: PilN domain-containing protein [Pirellulales bacterium]|nr:PilN domain-containing protein [Pirellulales bacterium]